MLSRLNAIYAEKKQLIGFINTSIGDHHGNSFDFIIVDPLTENKMASITYKIDRIQAFLEILPTMKNVFKGIIIDLFKLNLRGTPYHFSYKYCEELRKIFRQKKIPSVFLTEQICIFTSYLIAAKINVEFDDTVLFVLTADVYKDGKETLGVLAATFKFTPNGYQLINIKKISSFNAKEKPELLHRQICGDSSLNPPPKHVIIPTYGSKKIPFKKIFKSYNLILINACVENFQKEFLIETCKWLLDKSYIKYHILPLCSRDIQVYGYFGTDENILDILHVDTNDPLPISKTAIQSRSLPKSVVNYSIERVDYGIEGRLPPICHGAETTLTIDEDNIEKIETILLFIEDFDKLPSKLNNMLPSKIPFIAFFDNLSFIATYKESNGYKFLKEWNGIFGVDCFISFDQKKPKFGLEAMEVILTKNTFVVFDLIKIMSMPSENIQIEKTWGFKITKDENNPVLLEIDNFDGEKKVASPAFLMALFLRQQIKAIQESNNDDDGEKPKEIAFWIPKQKFNDEEYQRIQNGITKSCELLKLEFRFLDSETFDSSFTMDQYQSFEDSFFE